ncbi:hypothetical protein SAV14893_025860 [Streptomyces avermitilis]|uniref:Uncharacterized protein n=1 Tax=Streptomyces avermitilis TaxID=33903 RepID=A0A4D4LYA7_STRAX|nr:hypothetical protein SAV14893_025860 [Streptomyces avermitilis]
MVAGGRHGEVAGHGERGGGHEVSVPEAVADGQAAEGGGEEPGGEGVAGPDGGDDIDLESPDEGDRVR